MSDFIPKYSASSRSPSFLETTVREDRREQCFDEFDVYAEAKRLIIEDLMMRELRTEKGKVAS